MENGGTKMRKIAAILICLMLLAPATLAEGAQTMVVDYGSGSMLIAADGTPLTQVGDYDFIYRLSGADCPPERALFYAIAQMDAVPDDEFDEEVEDWPDDGGELDDEVVDIPLELYENPEELDIGEVVDSDYDFAEFEGPYETMSALMDARGNLLTDYAYIIFTHDVENGVVIGYRADGFVSALDEKGNVLVEGEYAALVSDTKGGFFATKPDLTMTDEYGDFYYRAPLVHVRADGSEAETGLITVVSDLAGFSSGLMCIPVFADMGAFGQEPDDDARYIYVDTDGKDAFGQSFTGAYNFFGNYADVTDEDFNGRLIDRTGAYVTEKAYSWFDFGAAEDGMPIVANLVDGGFDLLSKEDLSVIKSFDPAENGATYYAYQSGDRLIFAFSDEEINIIDGAGRVIYTGAAGVDAYTYYFYSDSQPGRMLISQGDWPEGECQVMDFAGNPTSDSYQEIIALTWQNSEGRYQVASYDIIDDEDGRDADYESYRYGLIDQDGNTILEMKYEEMVYLAPDRYWVSDGGAYQLMDADGNIIYEMSETE